MICKGCAQDILEGDQFIDGDLIHKICTKEHRKFGSAPIVVYCVMCHPLVPFLTYRACPRNSQLSGKTRQLGLFTRNWTSKLYLLVRNGLLTSVTRSVVPKSRATESVTKHNRLSLLQKNVCGILFLVRISFLLKIGRCTKRIFCPTGLQKNSEFVDIKTPPCR